MNHHPTLTASIFALSLSTACAAHSAPARTFRYADLVQHPERGRHAFDQPLILAFEPGDRLPIVLDFEDESFELDPESPALALVAKQHCYVRIDDRGMRASTDPNKFDETPQEPGSFFFGFSHRDTGPSLQLRVRTPKKP